MCKRSARKVYQEPHIDAQPPLKPSARIRINRIIQIRRNRPRRHSLCSYTISSNAHHPSSKNDKEIKEYRTQLTLIRPPIIPQIRPPAPKQPTSLLLIRDDLRREPLRIPRDVLIRGRKPRAGVELDVVGDAEAEFADYGGRVAAAVVVAGEIEVGGGSLVGAWDVDVAFVSVFEVAVVVVGGEGCVGEVLLGFAGVPFCVLGAG